MRAAVIGASGQLGSELVTLWGEDRAVGLGRDRIDLADPDTIAPVLDEVAPGLVVNAAAYNRVDDAEGDLEAAMAVNTRAREVMLPLLFFPVAIPVIMAAVEASGMVLGDAGLGETARWLSLLAAFDAIFLVVCPFAFHLVVED